MQRTGIGKALLAAVLFGLSTPLAKGLLAGTSPQLIAGLLYLGSGLGLGGLWILHGWRTRAEAPLTRRDAPWLAGAIAAGGVLGPLLLLTGLARTPASSASLLLNLEGVFTALIAWFVFRENVDRRIALGMSVIVLGGGLLSWQGQLAWGSLIGPLAIVGATLAWGIDNNLTQRVSASDPVQMLWSEPLTPVFLAAAALMALGLWLHLSERHDHWHVHEPMTHTHAHVHDEHHQHAHPPGTPPGEPHTHEHTHARLEHSHPHYPDIHHRHGHQ
jgi:drug/metabolite transporter (DMT)-like permease